MITLHNHKTHARGLFLKEGLKKLKTHGSLFPSSKYLGKRMLQHVTMSDGVCIVELGAGTGAFTEMIISRLPERSRLVVLEINPAMAKHLRERITDSRVIIIEGNATDLSFHLAQNGLEKPDYIISGLPLGNFSHALRESILVAIHESLSDRGLYIQFQYFLASLKHIRSMFDTKVLSYEYRNLPPAFVYGCKKKVHR